MINTTIIKIPAYTTREFRNFGVHKANELYDYKFTVQDLALLNSGAIKLFPRAMCDFIELNRLFYKVLNTTLVIKLMLKILTTRL